MTGESLIAPEPAPGAIRREGANDSRNPGTPLRPEVFLGYSANTSAAQRRAASLAARRSIKRAFQAA